MSLKVNSLEELMVISEGSRLNLVKRISLMYKIYNDSKAILDSDEFANLNKSDKKFVTNLRERSRDFLLTVFSLPGVLVNESKTLQRLVSQARDRDSENTAFFRFINRETAKPHANDIFNRVVREYRYRSVVPGREIVKPNPVSAPSLDPEQVRFARAKGNWTRLIRTALAKNRGEALSVNDGSKRADRRYRTQFLTPEEIESKYIYVNPQGELVEKLSNNEFAAASTKNNISHDKRGFAAFVFTLNGDLILFDHHNMDDLIAHSSMAFQASVFSAGEMKIEYGKLLTITPHSGHYKPNAQNMYLLLKRLEGLGVDLSESTISLWKRDDIAGLLSSSNGGIPLGSPKRSKEIDKRYNAQSRAVNTDAMVQFDALTFMQYYENQIKENQKNDKRVIAELTKQLAVLGLREINAKSMAPLKDDDIVKLKLAFEAFFHRHAAHPKAKVMLESALLVMTPAQLKTFNHRIIRDIGRTPFTKANQFLYDVLDYAKRLKPGSSTSRLFSGSAKKAETQKENNPKVGPDNKKKA